MPSDSRRNHHVYPCGFRRKVMAKRNHCERGEVSLSRGVVSEASGGNLDFDLVVSYHGYPDGDNDGSSQEEPWSTQDKIEKILHYFADGIYEATEGVHRIRKVRIYKGGKKADDCNIQWIEEIKEKKLGITYSTGTIVFTKDTMGMTKGVKRQRLVLGVPLTCSILLREKNSIAKPAPKSGAMSPCPLCLCVRIKNTECGLLGRGNGCNLIKSSFGEIRKGMCALPCVARCPLRMMSA